MNFNDIIFSVLISKALTERKESGTIFQIVLRIQGSIFRSFAITKGCNPVKNDSMNKNDLVASVAEISGLTKADASRAIDGVIQSIASVPEWMRFPCRVDSLQTFF